MDAIRMTVMSRWKPAGHAHSLPEREGYSMPVENMADSSPIPRSWLVCIEQLYSRVVHVYLRWQTSDEICTMQVIH
jgi:hypothetical protein